MDTHFVSTSFQGGRVFNSEINGHSIITDAVIADGGNNEGPGPKRLMLASLAGCTGIDIVSILDKMKASYSQLVIDVQASLSEDHPKTYTHVKVVYKIKIAEADQNKMAKAVNLSEEKYCGVMAMFKHFAKVDTEIEYL